MYDDEVIKIVNDNAAMVKAVKEAKARYRAYKKVVRSRIVSYVGFEAIIAVLMAMELIAPVLAIPIMCVSLFVMGVDIGVNYRVFMPRK